MLKLFYKCQKIKLHKIKIRNFCSSYNKDPDEMTIKNYSIFNVKKVLKMSGCNFEDGFTCIKTNCPVCNHSESTKKISENIYLNKITGDFFCSACHYSGTWNKIEKFFSNNKTSKIFESNRKHFLDTKIKQIVPIVDNYPETVKLFNEFQDYEKDKILVDLDITNIPIASLNHLNVSYDANRNSLIFPMIDVEQKIVGYKILTKNAGDSKHEEVTLPEAGSFGVILIKPINSKLKDSSTAIVVLSILDLLALNIQKINATVICLPHGVKSLPQECLPIMERYQKLVLWFSYDVAGWDTARNFARKLDEKRCVFVRPTEDQPSPYTALQQELDIKTILSRAQPVLHKSITTFSSLRQDVLSDLQNIDKVQGVKWKRYPSLNKYLKGHRKGELTILTGPTGCGKTTFMSEYSLDLALQGVSTLWGSFEIRNTRLASTLLRQMSGQPLDENLAVFDYWADEFEKLPIYFMTFHGQQSIKIVMDAIDHAQYIHDIHHVIIDNVQFMMGMSDEIKHIDRFWKQDAIIAAFRTFATRRNCHVTLVIHPRKERDAEDLTTSSIFGSAKATQEADNVLIIQDRRLTSLRGKKYLQIAKNRYSGDLGIMPMDFDKHSLSYAQKTKKKIEDKSDKQENVH